MGSKSAEWRPGPSVCRCCLAEGCYKDISTEYFWMGKREVYAEMLKDTFDLSVAYSKSKGPNSNSRLICEPCIARLRDATDFKRQVRECERTFLQHLDPACSADLQLDVAVDAFTKPVKIEEGDEVKEEALASDFEADDVPDFNNDDDDDDDLDDQPLTTLASKIPKKENVDFTDLLDNAKGAEKRKSSSKSKASPAKKLKPSKQKVEKAKPKPEKKKKGESAQTLARRNAKIIVAYTTAYPFRQREESNLMCVYCCESYPDPVVFRKHMDEEHTTCHVDSAFMHAKNIFLKVDLTEMKCRLCRISLDGIDEAAAHLNESHAKVIRGRFNFDHPIGLQPFKFCGTKIACVICEKHFPSIRLLSRHMSTHYLKFTCEECGKSYASKESLQQHVRMRHASEKHLCVRCWKGFSSLEERRLHMESSERCWHYICYECNIRFYRYPEKVKHQIEVHGQEKKYARCLECGKVFQSNKTLGQHFAKEHAGESFVCNHCGRVYPSRRNLTRHVAVVHNKGKN